MLNPQSLLGHTKQSHDYLVHTQGRCTILNVTNLSWYQELQTISPKQKKSYNSIFLEGTAQILRNAKALAYNLGQAILFAIQGKKETFCSVLLIFFLFFLSF